MINAFTVDLEYWYSAELLRGQVSSNKEHLLVETVSPILSLLKEYNTRATFFVLGKVAEEHPEVVERISEEGHEIASNAYSHARLHQLGKDGFEQEISKSLTLLKRITGENPLGFRAPTFSLDNATRWALPVLRDYGFKYDSSIVPCKTRLYGVPGAPLRPYHPSFYDPRAKGLSLLDRLVTYYGISSSLEKLEALLQEFKFGPLEGMLPQ